MAHLAASGGRGSRHLQRTARQSGFEQRAQDQIVPRSGSALENARAGWEASRTTFRDVLEARRMWLEGQVLYARAVAEQYDLLSELVLCCGLGQLESLNVIDALPNSNNTNKP